MKVGDYVRTCCGTAKIVKIEKNTVIVDKGIDIYDEGCCNYLLKIYIVKSSPNIIDLIETGDYVNGKKVIKNCLKDGGNIVLFEDGFCARNEEIKSIVTKEQFEEMEYKIND